MNRKIRRTALLMCAVMLLTAVPAAAWDDFDAITSHVDLAVSQKLRITRPSKDITTAANYYYLMGNSDSAQELYMNGTHITTRGKMGTFGVYVQLPYGKNLLEFKQGDVTESVYITRADTPGTVSTTSSLSQAYPSCDTAAFAGEAFGLSCVAPSGAQVNAIIGSSTIPMQQAAAAQAGVPAHFRASCNLPDMGGTANIGPVKYTMTWQGKTSWISSTGKVYTASKSSPLLVQVTQVSSAVLTDDKASGYVATAKKGAVATVVATGNNNYQLSTGGWISKANVQPLIGNISGENILSSARFETEEGGERFVLTGTQNPLAQCWQADGKLMVELNNTTGLTTLPLENSRLFSAASVTQKANNSLLMELTLAPSATLWGYVVEYKDGVTSLYCKYKPRLSGDATRPLKGITVALDSGHGSADPGALGMGQLVGPNESNINRATAVAVKKRLESMGAKVLLPDVLDLNSRFDARMQPALDSRADLFISLHCNSTVENANGNTAKGIEIYYYEEPAKAFGQALLTQMTAQTGRSARGVGNAAFRVTLNSLAPSVLVEMGFMTNPVEYDSLCSRQGIYQMANAVGDGIKNFLL